MKKAFNIPDLNCRPITIPLHHRKWSNLSISLMLNQLQSIKISVLTHLQAMSLFDRPQLNPLDTQSLKHNPSISQQTTSGQSQESNPIIKNKFQSSIVLFLLLLNTSQDLWWNPNLSDTITTQQISLRYLLTDREDSTVLLFENSMKLLNKLQDSFQYKNTSLRVL